jgi:hypothetical protein
VNRLFCLLLIIVGLQPALAEDTQKVTSLIKETQKLTTDVDTLVLAWWIPNQYWEESLKNNPRITDAQKEDLRNALQDYTVVCVVDAKKGGLAVFNFTPAEDIIKTAKLTDPDGETLTPLADSDLTPAAQNHLSMMKPVFANLLGKLGQNSVFVVFPSKDSNGKMVADPLGEGRLSFVENGHSFSWRLPLASLLPEKICPKCQEHLPGSYHFCPYDGAKLE